jgi:hypothetical protein
VFIQCSIGDEVIDKNAVWSMNTIANERDKMPVMNTVDGFDLCSELFIPLLSAESELLHRHSPSVRKAASKDASEATFPHKVGDGEAIRGSHHLLMREHGQA